MTRESRRNNTTRRIHGFTHLNLLTLLESFFYITIYLHYPFSLFVCLHFSRYTGLFTSALSFNPIKWNYNALKTLWTAQLVYNCSSKNYSHVNRCLSLSPVSLNNFRSSSPLFSPKRVKSIVNDLRWVQVQISICSHPPADASCILRVTCSTITLTLLFRRTRRVDNVLSTSVMFTWVTITINWTVRGEGEKCTPSCSEVDCTAVKLNHVN